jgi:hypothetical protein
LRQIRLLATPLVLLALLLPACGIEFGDGDENHEPLASLRVVGTPIAGEELRLELDYAQTYPVPVQVECRLKQGSQVVQIIGSDVIEANPDGEPEAAPVTGTLSFTFEVDIPGKYGLECLTPADPENKLKGTLTVAPREGG